MNPFLNTAQVLQDMIVCSGPDCGWSDLVVLATRLINNLIVIAGVLLIIGFIFVGIKLLISAGDPNAMSEAKKMAGKMLKGLLAIILAWFVVYLISNVLLKSQFTILGQ